ncbi:MAG: class I SAM-dependent methyltransferase [Polyangiales bacterium]
MSERHVYEYDVDPNSDTAPARVCRMVGSGKRVLEIGAGPGSITRVLRAQKNQIVALELDPTAIPFLSQHCDKVVSANLDEPSWAGSFEERFDAVVAADVLEHLTDPWATLGRMKSLLAPGGALILSLPHAAHACILACLLHEDVEYRDWGLLDRTHIRFFGLRNLQAMIEKAGLKVVRGEFVVRAPAETEFKDKWDALDHEAQSFLGKQRFAQVYQVVMMAAPASDPRPAVDLLELDPASFGAKPLQGSWLPGNLLPGVANKAIRAVTDRLGKR